MRENLSELQIGTCQVCKAAAPGQPVRVLLIGLRLGDWHLCRSCWRHLERGFHRTIPEGAFEPYLDGRRFRFTEPQIRCYITAGLQPDEEWRRLVGGKLRAIGVEFEEAAAANDRYDWPAVLEAARMIQGTAVIMRAALEGMLGPRTADAGPPRSRTRSKRSGCSSARERSTACRPMSCASGCTQCSRHSTTSWRHSFKRPTE